MQRRSSPFPASHQNELAVVRRFERTEDDDEEQSLLAQPKVTSIQNNHKKDDSTVNDILLLEPCKERNRKTATTTTDEDEFSSSKQQHPSVAEFCERSGDISQEFRKSILVVDHHHQRRRSSTATAAAAAATTGVEKSNRIHCNDDDDECPTPSKRRSSISSHEETTTTAASVLESLSLNKLRFAELTLHGRDEEQEILKRCFWQTTTATTTKTTAPNVQDAGQQQQQHSNSNSATAAINNNKNRSSSSRRQVVLISGESGTGKTALAWTLRACVVGKKNQQGLFVSGKCDWNHHDHRNQQPFTCIAAACREVCSAILSTKNSRPVSSSSNSSSRNKDPAIPTEQPQHDKTTTKSTKREFSFKEMRDAFVSELGTELSVLTSLIPDLRFIVARGGQDDGLLEDDDDDMEMSLAAAAASNNRNPQQQHHQADARHEDAKNRFHNAFRRFFRLVTKYFSPLVVLLDDLQWADPSSLELLQILVSDRENNGGLMVVGCFRSSSFLNRNGGVEEEVSSSSTCLGKSMTWLREQALLDGSSFGVTEIHLENLHISAVNRILMDLLSLDAHDTWSLAQVCFKRTLGNAFFLISFVSMLYEQGLLEFNLGSMQWTWNAREIENQTGATINVVEMTRAKMRRLPVAMTRLLQLTSCLGSSFDTSSVRLVWKQIVGTDNLEALLSLALEEGFLEWHGTSGYRFIHDAIQESARLLIDSDELSTLQFRIGQIFVDELSSDELKGSIFMVVDLLNQGPVDLRIGKRTVVAELNLQAAKKAAELSAFQSAARYAEKGIELLPWDKWQEHYDLSLDLFSTGAELEASLGNCDQTEKYCHEVLNLGSAPLLDKLRAYGALIHSVAICRDNIAAAVELCLTVLKELGCRFPTRKPALILSIICGLLRTNAKLKSLTHDNISKLPMMTDRQRSETMKFMNQLFHYCYLSKNPLLVLVALRTVHWTLEHGVCESSPEAFVFTGLVVTGKLKDFASGARLIGYTSLLMEKTKCRSIEARVKFEQAYLAPWTSPFRSSLSPLRDAYETGMRSGDISFAALAIAVKIMVGYISGLPLDCLEADCRTYLPQLLDLKQTKQCSYIKLMWQLILNFQGRSNEPLLLTGQAMNQDAFVEIASSQKHPDLLPRLQVNQTHLYAYFGEHELGADLALSKGDTYEKAFPTGSMVASDAFLRAISLFAAARRSGKSNKDTTTRRNKRRKYIQEAGRLRSKIASFVKKGNPNTRHYQALLDAEMAAFKGNIVVAKSCYEQAIVMSAKTGFVQDAALANERFYEFFLHDLSDQVEALHHLDEAMRFYSSWGAIQKVELLRRKHQELATPAHPGLTSTRDP